MSDTKAKLTLFSKWTEYSQTNQKDKFVTESHDYISINQACDVLLDFINSTSDKFIKKPLQLIKEFKNEQGLYTIDYLEKRISAPYSKNIMEILKVISKARVYQCSKNLDLICKKLAFGLLKKENHNQF